MKMKLPAKNIKIDLNNIIKRIYLNKAFSIGLILKKNRKIFNLKISNIMKIHRKIMIVKMMRMIGLIMLMISKKKRDKLMIMIWMKFNKIKN